MAPVIVLVHQRHGERTEDDIRKSIPANLHLHLIQEQIPITLVRESSVNQGSKTNPQTALYIGNTIDWQCSLWNS